MTLTRAGAMLLAGATMLSTAVSASADTARTFTISGRVTLSTGAVADQLSIAACSTDCLNHDANVADVTEPAPGTGEYSLNVPPGTYVLLLLDVASEPGYTEASGAQANDGYLAPQAGNADDTLVESFAGATQVIVKAPGAEEDIVLGAAIHNPQNTFTQSTPGTLTDRPCAHYTTTFHPSPFADLPADASVTYQWSVGTMSSTTVLPGATGLTYTSTTGEIGEHLIVEMQADAPGRIGWDKVVDLGVVGGDECVPLRPRVPVTSYGVKRGRPVGGGWVSVAGVSAPGSRIAYSWMLDGRVVHRGASYRVPRRAQGHRLAVRLTFSEAGYLPRSVVRTFGTVRPPAVTRP